MILYISRWLGGCHGAAKSGWDALGGLVASGHTIHVVTRQRTELPRWLAEVAGDRVRMNDLGGRWAAAGRSVWNSASRAVRPLLREPKIASVLHATRRQMARLGQLRSERLTLTERPRLIVVNSLGSHRDYLAIRDRHDAPAVLIVRESPGHYRHGQTDVDYATAVASLRDYAALIFVSSRCREAWLAEPELRDIPSFYVPNCCDEEEIGQVMARGRDEHRSELGLADDRFVALCVASLQPRKGQDLIVDQLPALIAAVPRLEVQLLGPDSRGFAKQLLRAARAAGHGNRLIVRSPATPALAAIRAADALLLPARAEAMPRVILEAMALRTPVVATDVDGIPELVEHGQTGWLYSLDRPAGMVEGLERLATAPDTARSLALAGEERYWRQFSRAELNRRYAEIVDQLLAGEFAPREAA